MVPRWARKTLSYPYLSDSQASEAATALSGNDSCITNPAEEVTFRNSGRLKEMLGEAAGDGGAGPRGGDP